MVIRRRIHAGQVYLGKEIMELLGVKDGDEVELEVRNGEVIIRSVKEIDENTMNLLMMLKKPRLQVIERTISENTTSKI